MRGLTIDPSTHLALVVARAAVYGAQPVLRVAVDLGISHAQARALVADAAAVLRQLSGVSVDTDGDCLSVVIADYCATCPLVAGGR